MGRKGAVTRRRRLPNAKAPDMGTLAGMFAESMRQARIDRALRQHDVSKRASWDQARVGLLEAGDHAPTLATVETWLKGLGASIRISIRFKNAAGEKAYRNLAFGVEADE